MNTDLDVKFKILLNEDECSDLLITLQSRRDSNKTVTRLEKELSNFLDNEGYYEG